jgi:hypothetical protein
LADQGVEHEVAYREAGRQRALLTRSEALGPVASTARCAVDADNCVDLPSCVVPDGPLLHSRDANQPQSESWSRR